MNEEINKIIELLKCKEDSYCCLHYKECELLLDYITNLHKKYENAVADYEVEKYKNIKALSWTNRIIEIIKQQPSEDDTWILINLHSIKHILQGSDEK